MTTDPSNIGESINVWDMKDGQRIAERYQGRYFYATVIGTPHEDESDKGFWSILVQWDGDIQLRSIGQTKDSVFNMEFYAVKEGEGE